MTDYAAAAACDLDAYGAWCRGLLDRGVYPPPSQFEAWFPSLAHTEDDAQRTIDAAAGEAFGAMMSRWRRCARPCGPTAATVADGCVAADAGDGAADGGPRPAPARPPAVRGRRGTRPSTSCCSR